MEMLNWLPFYIYLVNMILNIRLHSSHAHEFIFDIKKNPCNWNQASVI